MAKEVIRCAWAGIDAKMCHYHDTEWGVPIHDSRSLWEKLILDGFQAGLSWKTILHKRDAFREAFDDFDPEKIVRYGKRDVDRLMANAGIIRSASKIAATVGNARAFLDMREAGEDFAGFAWKIAGGKPLRNRWVSPGEVPAQTESSVAMSKALKQRGFKFVGPVIVYAWMQATGMVNDHVQGCFRYRKV
jgi:DNA-3-methyladenine glycosylase I